MISCISSTVNSRAKPLTIIRSAPGHYDHGRWQPGDIQNIPVKGAVQPLRPEEISRLEDSRHIIEAIKIYATDSFRNLMLEKQTQPDTVVYQDKNFEVYSVANWDHYSKILAVRKEE